MVNRWIEANNIFWKHIGPNEHVGIITVPKRSIQFTTVSKLPNRVKDYLTRGLYKKSPKHKLSFKDPKYRDWQDEIETYIKSVWLTRDFINDGKLKNPVGMHWNPKERKWIIHPGGSRQVILYHYYGDEITGIGYNTKGHKVKFEHKFSSVEEIKEFYNANYVHLSIVEQYDTIVPHIHIDSTTIQETVNDLHKRVQEFYRTTHIDANFNLEKYGYKSPDKKFIQNKIRVTIDKQDENTIMKAFMIMPSFDTFDNYGVKIERT